MTAIPAPIAQPAAPDAAVVAHGGHGHDHAGHGHADHPPISFVKKYLFSTDHKVIGIQFLLLGLFFLAVGGVLALIVRWQLAWPHVDVAGYKPVPVVSKLLGWKGGAMPPDFYNAAFTMHASIMIFLVIIPLLVGTFGNYLIPLKIGAPDMAFPFLNGAAFWTALPAGMLLVASFFLPGGAAGAGWTSYPTLSTLWMPESAPIHSPQALLFTGEAVDRFTGGFHLDVARFLLLTGHRPDGQVTHSGWPAIPLLSTSAGLFLCFLFLAAYQVRLGFRPLNWVVGVVLAAAGAYGGIMLFQFLAFDGQSAWFFAIFLLGFSSIMGAVNYLTTIVKLRAPGMTMFRLPLSVWSLFITSILVLLATPVLASTLFMNLLDH
ncbi:MAG TPA: cbb3-type cytochrome c oxidase subunit I, partial [Humisphaera sp.]